MIDTATLILSISFLVIISSNIKNDLSFLLTGKNAKARVEHLQKDGGYYPYSIRYSFYDEFLEQRTTITDRIGGHFGAKIESDHMTSIEIAYTKNRIYFVDVKTPTWRMFAFRFFIWCVISWFTIYSLKRILKWKRVSSKKDEQV